MEREIVVTGTVVHGKKEASALGYPTVNMAYTLAAGMVLEPGVYSGRVLGVVAGDHTYEYAAAVVIGGDFGTQTPLKLEAHILDLEGVDLYGQILTLRIIKKMRELRHFKNSKDLQRQIAEDIDAIVEFFTTLVPYA